MFICLSVHGESENVFRGRIIDAETGEPVAATVSVLDEHGQEIAPEGDLDHVTYLGKKRWYSNGEFSVHTSKDNLFLEIRRGLETIPVQESVSFINSQSVSKTYELVAWTDMTKKGYMSADVHTHFQRLESTLKQMQAENLQVVNILIRDSNDDVDLFTGSVDPISTDEYFIYVGQEYRDMQMGHVNFMNPKSLVEPIDAVGGSHLHVGGNPNLLLTPSIQKARKQGSVVAWSHFSNLPGLESIIAIPLGLIDTVELLNWEDPIQLPSHQTVWDYSLIPMVDFPILRGMDLYFQYLNAGFQIPITAGTDKLRSNIPLGSNRHYVRINGIADFESCLEGIKRGTGFVTNGPMLSLEVDNSVPGDTSDFEDVRRVKVLVKAESILPFARLELIANGNIVYSKPLENYRKKRELYTLELETEVSIDESTWFAARVTSLDTPKLLPRNLSVFAHSNPIYFLKNQEPVRIESSINYLIDYAEQVENWIQNHAEFRNDEEKELALEYLQKAEQILREKLYLRNGNR